MDASAYRKPDLKALVIHAGDEKSFLIWGLGGVEHPC